MSTGYGIGAKLSVGQRGQQRQQLKHRLSVDPKVVMQGRLLELNQAELDAAVEMEMMENPALTRLEEPDPITNEEVLKKVAPQELAPSGDWHEGKRSLPSDEPSSWVELAARQTSLDEHLFASLIPMLPSSLKGVGEYAIHSLDERGYLDISLEELAYEANCNLDEADLVIKTLQSCEPAGIGASTLCECLMLQLQGDDNVSVVARLILADAWEEFIAGRHQRIARKLGVLLPLVKRSCLRIKGLCPYPAEAFGTGHYLPSASVPTTADLQIERTELGWNVTVQGISCDALGIEPYYRKKYKEIGEGNAVAGARQTDEARHVIVFVKRAHEFIEAIQVRSKTMHRIGAYLATEQAGFLSTGSYRFLKSLTRSKMAKDLGLHESTVSRATAGKHIQVPSGEVVAFEVFFKPALRVQKMIEEILEHENPANPLSDEAISVLLAELGVTVARRTVHKYRDRARLNSSRRRRAA